MSEYTKESIDKVIDFLNENPLKAGMYLYELDKPAFREVIEKYLLPCIFDFIKRPMQEELNIITITPPDSVWIDDVKRVKIEYKKCITDILVKSEPVDERK